MQYTRVIHLAFVRHRHRSSQSEIEYGETYRRSTDCSVVALDRSRTTPMAFIAPAAGRRNVGLGSVRRVSDHCRASRLGHDSLPGWLSHSSNSKDAAAAGNDDVGSCAGAVQPDQLAAEPCFSAALDGFVDYSFARYVVHTVSINVNVEPSEPLSPQSNGY